MRYQVCKEIIVVISSVMSRSTKLPYAVYWSLREVLKALEWLCGQQWLVKENSSLLG